MFSKTPFRISLFGGGTDFPEWFNKNDGLVISTSINKYSTIGIRNLPPFFTHNYRIVYSKIDLANSIRDISHPVVRSIFEQFKVKKGMELHYFGDLPARSGIGSSSSFTVGLLNLMYNMYNKKISNSKLARQAIKIEREILKEDGGWQDQIAVANGGFNFINFNKNNYSIQKVNIKKNNIKKINESLLMFYVGNDRKSYVIQKKLKKNMPNLQYEMQSIHSIAKEAKKIILSEKNYHKLGILMNESWNVKRKLTNSISNDYIDQIYDKALKMGATGGKLIGAGGAGFMIFYCPKKKQNKLINSLKNLIHIPFKFETEGTLIIK
tara:strand:- start:3905 stop:4873 length:969 start_codon:yes stop_codon:yes gene_type:complete